MDGSTFGAAVAYIKKCIAPVKSALTSADKFLGDTSTDLGTHTITTETDLTNMTASTSTVSNVKYIVTQTTISANGTATANSLKIAQDNIPLAAGYYMFKIDHVISSANYQIQIFDITNNTTMKAFSSSTAIPEYYFTLDSAITARIRAFAVNGANVNNELHTVTLKKISKQTYDNNVAYYLMGLGSTENDYYTNIEIGGISGTDGSTAGNNARCRTKDFISIDDFVMCDLLKEPNYDLFVFLYGSDKSFLERIPGSWTNRNYTHDDIITENANTKYIKLLFRRHNDSNVDSTDIAVMQGVILVKKTISSIESFDEFRANEIKSRFDGQFNYIAYSVLSSNDAPINSAEHFIHCGKQIFTALKGDVRNTSDGGLIMCHDPGYTFDGNSKITAYDSTNKTLINTLTVAQCKALTFAAQYNSSDVHPTDFDTFVKICKMYGKIAFVNVRDEAIESVVVPQVISTLKKYRMLDRAIINSFTYATLKKFREYDSEIMLSLVLNQNTAPAISTVDMVKDIGNCILNLFDVPLPSGSTLDAVLTVYDPVLHYATNNNVPVYEAQTQNTHTDTLLAHGITGSQMTQIPDYMS